MVVAGGGAYILAGGGWWLGVADSGGRWWWMVKGGGVVQSNLNIQQSGIAYQSSVSWSQRRMIFGLNNDNNKY